MRIGFEIEVEDVTYAPSSIPCVSATTDGSLRNGMEFISEPLPDIEFASFLYAWLHKNIQGTYSERCGFHFHMDFVDSSLETRKSFLVRYLKLERALFREFPELFRSNNNFCPLLLDSPNELAVLRKYFQRNDSYQLENFSKYSALNFKPLIALGTVEFRAAPAGLPTEEVNRIFNIFQDIYNGTSNPTLDALVTPEDLAEVEAVVTLINTPLPEQSSELGEFLSEHFDVVTPTVAIPTEEAIREFLQGL